MIQDDDVFLFPEDETPKPPTNILARMKPIQEMFPNGFFIVVPPERIGSVFNMYKFNPKNYELFTRLEQYVKQICGWSAGNQN